MEVNVDMNSLSLPVTLLIVLLRTHCQAAAHWFFLREEDIPGASLNGCEPSQLHVVELKHWVSAELLQQLGRSRTL